MAVITQEVALDTVRRVLGARHKEVATDIAPDTQLESLGLDSLDIAELFLQLENATSTELDPSSAEGLKTVGDLVELRPL
jgi:acyl carrier protein